MNYPARLLMSVILSSTVAAAVAQNPGAVPITRVETVLQGAKDDWPVELRGRILHRVSRDLYVFKDDTGEIPVEIPGRALKGGRPLTPGAQVVIRGEVDKRLFRSPKIEAHDVDVLPQSGPTPAAQ
jgi:uncharacterized protein (TIGR00156 family)